MLKINSISKSYIQRGTVLSDLDLTVNEGDTIAVTGPSGSGKTTLLNIIGLLDHPDSGDVRFRDMSILGFNDDQAASYRNTNIGFVFQEHNLLPHLTILENILLPSLARRLSDSEYAAVQLYAEELMTEMGILAFSAKYPFQVSGGEAQRASLVRALINRPSVLLADEPTGSLDSENAGIMGDLLLEINRLSRISLILATHSESLAEKMLVKYRLEKGKLIKT